MGQLDEMPSTTASLGLHLATRSAPAERGSAVRDLDQLLELYERGAVALDDTVRIAAVTTTVGRHLVAACLPPRMADAVDTAWSAVAGRRLLVRIVHELHVVIAERCAVALERLGTSIAERSGLSLAAGDFMPPPEARDVLAEARESTLAIEKMYDDGLITDAERFQREVDTWTLAADRARLEARRRAPERDALAACVASVPGAMPAEAIRSFCGVIGRYQSAIAMTGTFGDGVPALEYFVRAGEARRGLLTGGECRRLAYELARDIDAMLADVAIIAIDCGTARGMRVAAREFDDDGALASRIAGSVAAEDVHDRTGALLVAAGTLLTPALARLIESERIASVVVRDVRTCEASPGVCARCFGLAPEDGLWTCIGDRVGARAAATIGAKLGQLEARRVFHIC